TDMVRADAIGPGREPGRVVPLLRVHALGGYARRSSAPRLQPPRRWRAGPGRSDAGTPQDGPGSRRGNTYGRRYDRSGPAPDPRSGGGPVVARPGLADAQAEPPRMEDGRGGGDQGDPAGGDPLGRERRRPRRLSVERGRRRPRPPRAVPEHQLGTD